MKTPKAQLVEGSPLGAIVGPTTPRTSELGAQDQPSGRRSHGGFTGLRDVSTWVPGAGDIRVGSVPQKESHALLDTKKHPIKTHVHSSGQSQPVHLRSQS